MGAWYHSQRQQTFLKQCKFLSEKQLNETDITKIGKKYPFFSLNIIDLYKSPVILLPFHIWEIAYVNITQISDDWQWNIDRVQLKGDFPS